MATTRIYLVQPIQAKAGDTTSRLVRAANINQALRHVAAGIIDGRVARQDDIVAGILAGVKIETAGEVRDEADALA